MSLAPSSMQPLGTKAPEFTLFEPLTGEDRSLKDLHSQKGTVICFICNHCPFVAHIRKQLATVAKEYMAKGFSFIAINANDPADYPEDSPEQMTLYARDLFPFPYLFDATQEVAKAYGAVCTPDFFIYNQDMKLVYRGQFDDSRPGNNFNVTGMDLKAALDALDQGAPVPAVQKPSIGCNIKWRS